MNFFGYDLVEELLGSVSRQYTILVAVADVSSISETKKKNIKIFSHQDVCKNNIREISKSKIVH